MPCEHIEYIHPTITTNTKMEKHMLVLPAHRRVVLEVKRTSYLHKAAYDKMHSLLTEAIMTLEEEAGPDHRDVTANQVVQKYIQEAVARKTSLMMLLNAYVYSFKPDITDWSRVPKEWGARFSIRPLSLFKTLSNEDKKSTYSLEYMFGGGSRKISTILLWLAQENRISTDTIRDCFKSDKIMSCLSEITELDKKCNACFLSVLKIVGATDNKRGGCIIGSADDCKSYYRWSGTQKTATVPMIMGMQRDKYPQDGTEWGALMKCFYGGVRHKQKLDQFEFPFDEEADEEYLELRAKYYEARCTDFDDDDDDDSSCSSMSDSSSDDDSVIDITDQVLQEREHKRQKMRDEAELIL
mmetsp:Transcript_20819/g.29821  ORF Transcript_20819/g.29821 Transcript_20819/m.29821 type:complete len:354 (+) Transcript_20819:33-1094(+)